MDYFPLLIEVTSPSLLEPFAKARWDYDHYLICNDLNELPLGVSFRVLQTNFTGHSVNKSGE